MTSSKSEAATPRDPQGASPSAEVFLTELLERRQRLLAEIGTLEQRRDRLQEDIRRHFAGSCDELSRRVQGFQDYLVGALQELSDRAQTLELAPRKVMVQPSPLDRPAETVPDQATGAASPFLADQPLIEDMIRGFQDTPDFYAPPWRLRRHLEVGHGEVLTNWLLQQQGRGAQNSLGSRSRNVLLGAAAVAILTELYGDQLQTLVLASTPERLGQWRRGLQDSLGLTREDFGPNANGISLFERSDALIERADRLESRDRLPLILVDAAEQVVDIPILQFPLWLAFAADGRELAMEDLDGDPL
ncbi:DUF3086 domain-containing protein [Candidatus Synechococcus spongiarum]|uniref:DUF3086 domain-containing protein n=1 Tax=Candidatus Synechococcus spongiarum LMB bulk15N TaxID=1943583 RepID=A0A1T1D029_9SYNE|nr:DUF3086 domain-containing protein [Candidatus Synechococcus spongiarum]OOV34174.1 hypothetical protein BV53_06280 [Candidatus Synechococcus spongiarum LMB bulk15N]